MAIVAGVSRDFDLVGPPRCKVRPDKVVGLIVVERAVPCTGKQTLAVLHHLRQIRRAKDRPVVVAGGTADRRSLLGCQPLPRRSPLGGSLDVTIEGCLDSSASVFILPFGKRLIKTGRAIVSIVLDDGDVPILPLSKALLSAVGDRKRVVIRTGQHLKPAARIAFLVELIWPITTAVGIAGTGRSHVRCRHQCPGITAEIRDSDADRFVAALRVRFERLSREGRSRCGQKHPQNQQSVPEHFRFSPCCRHA